MEQLNWDRIIKKTKTKEQQRRWLRELFDEDFAIEQRASRVWRGEVDEMENPYSITQLAKTSRVHHTTVSRFLRGERVRSDAERRLKKTLKELGVIDAAEIGDQPHV